MRLRERLHGDHQRPDPGARPIFVGGTGRSGTTVVGHWLGAHPDVVCHRTEVRFHITEGGFTKLLSGGWTPVEYAAAVRERCYDLTTATGRPKGLQLLVTGDELDAALDRFLPRAEVDLTRALAALSFELLDPYARGRFASTWVETTPDNTAHAAALTRVFPTGHVIHAVRDGRDVAASVAVQAWGPDTIVDALEWWGTRLRKAFDGTLDADPARVHVVRLEELVHLDREAASTRLLDQLEVADRDRLLAWFAREMDAARGNVGRWRSQTDAATRDRVDGRYRDILAELADAGVDCLPCPPEQVDALAGASG